MPIETRSNSALFRRAEQLKRWEDSDTNKEISSAPKDKKIRVKFSDGCVFLAACAAGDTDEVERLLKLGTDINTANVDGLTALHQACIDNNLEMVQFLVEHGCDVNRGDNEGWTPLHATAPCGFISIAKYLIENGANVAAVNNDGDLPIDIAESTEMEEFLSDVLDEQGIDCDEARSEEEQVMLEDAKQILNSNKFQDKLHPRTGASALHVAAAKGYIKVMNLLIQAGADLNAQDNDGWTPLHAASHWGQKEACAVLADNLANMDIQNFAGQTCFDVADMELVKLLEELKKKQASMQKERPEIQAILQRTSTRPPLKRRTSVTRMSGQEKSKSVIKDTKAERAHIEQLTLPEEEGEDEKEKRNNESFERLPKKGIDIKGDKEIIIQPKKVPTFESKPHPNDNQATVKEKGLERVPSWKKVLRRASENSDTVSNASMEKEPEVVPKKQMRSIADSETVAPTKTIEDTVNKDGLKSSEQIPIDPSSLSTEAFSESSSAPITPSSPSDTSSESQSQEKRRPFIPPVRDDESELQRKAHAKRVRETRRSTQGVLLEDIKSAELQFLINTQREAAKRQAEEAQLEDTEIKSETEKSSEQNSIRDTNTGRWSWKSGPVSSSKDSEDAKTSEKSDASTKSDTSKSHSEAISGEPSVTLVLKPKSASSPEESSTSESRPSPQGTQAAIQRRRRPKRRSTGVVYLDSDDAQEEKENKEVEFSTMGDVAERTRQRYGSSSSLPEASGDASSRSETPSRYSSTSCSRNSLIDEDKDYKMLYEEVKKENDRLKENLQKTEEELDKTKKQLQKLSQNGSFKNSISEAEKKERRTLERKLSEMEEEIKELEILKAENERLKEDNKALLRVITTLSSLPVTNNTTST